MILTLSRTPILTLTLGTSHGLLCTETGRVYAWGYERKSCSPIRWVPGLHEIGVKVVLVAAGAGYSLCLSSSGKVYSWGESGCGVLGTGKKISPTPTQIKTLDKLQIVDLATGGLQSLEILTSLERMNESNLDI